MTTLGYLTRSYIVYRSSGDTHWVATGGQAEAGTGSGSEG